LIHHTFETRDTMIPKLILYMGGCCGDIVTGLIDTKGISIQSGKCVMLKERAKLKRSFVFENDAQKNTYILSSGKHWKSLPTHDTEFHLKQKHEYIGITCKNKKVAIWCAERFRNLHTPVVWERICKTISITSTDEYAQTIIDFSDYIGTYAKHTLDIDDIIEGNAIEKLKEFTELDITSTIMYSQWLESVVDNSSN